MDFARSARFYDALYAARGKDYAGEARRLRRWLVPSKVNHGLALLDLGCGTGEHLRHLTDLAAPVVGLDVDRAMLAEARRKLPGAHLVCGDMARFALRQHFDAVLCLFAALGYLPDREAVAAAVAAMAAHLRPGGVLLVEPPLGPERLRPARRTHMSVDHGAAHIVRLTDAVHEAGRLRVRFEYRVEEPTGCEAFVEEHSILALPLSDVVELMKSNGLDVDHDAEWPSGPGLLVGRRH